MLKVWSEDECLYLDYEDEDEFFAVEMLEHSGGYGSESDAEEKPNIEDLKENILKKNGGLTWAHLLALGMLTNQPI